MNRQSNCPWDGFNNAQQPVNTDPELPYVHPEIVDDPPGKMGDLPLYEAPMGRYERDDALNICDPPAGLRPGMYVAECNVNIPSLQNVEDMRSFCHEHPE